MPSQRREPRKWAERYWGSPVVAQGQAPADVGGQLAPTVHYGVIDRLQGGVAVTGWH